MKMQFCKPTILDEFPEFDRRSIDALREPLENRTITVSRAKGTVTFPANFIFVAAMNPSRGSGGDAADDMAARREREKTERKISGPIMDRIDMWIEVAHVPHEKLSGERREGSESAEARAAVTAARDIQSRRFGKEGKTNSEMSVRDLDEKMTVSPSVKQLLNQAAGKMKLSPRAYHRVLKLARTIADLEAKEHVSESHVLEALQYRGKGVFG